MNNPLSKLAIDYWYHAVMVVSAVTFLLNGAGFLVAYPVGLTASVSAGAFFIGLGEWVNHPLQTTLHAGTVDFPAGISTGHPRKNKPIGVAFVFMGLFLIGLGAYGLYSKL